MKKYNLCFIVVCALILLGIHSIALGDWDDGMPSKWLQRPDLNTTGIDICVDDTGANGQRTIGDDFECIETGPITGVHLWGSWLYDNKGQITAIHISFYTDIPDPDPQDPATYSQPGTLLWERWFDASQIVERLYFTMPNDQYEGWWDPRAGAVGYIPNGDTQVWQYNISIPDDPFIQEGMPDQPIIYWLVVEVKIDQTIENTSFGWKTRDRNDGHFMDDAVWGTPDVAVPWHELIYPLGHEYHPDSIDMAFVLTSEDDPVADKDYGDAPEGAIAYPSLGVMGNFPTCITVGPASYIEHGLCWARFEMVPPPGFDFELDGNGGLCPGFAPYDNDECFMDGDAGLIFPDAYTIQGGIVVTCPQSTASVLGNTCTTATWGANVDIYVVNNMPVDGFVNVLMDWDQNGSWGGSSVCPTAGAPEYILQDFRVPVGFAGPLSALNPPSFLIGPNSGYIWTRFMISEAQLQNPQWDGSGIFEDGETEDYLLMVDSQIDELDFGDAPDSAAALGYPTLLPLGARHIIGGPWLGDASDGPDPEPDGQPTANADGDDNDGNDDEDGVNIPILTVGATSTITFEVNSADGTGGTVSGWIDYDGDKVWGSTATEQIVAASYPNGIYSVNVTPPAGSAGTTFARFRITRDTTVTGPTGPASDGEVEDYEVFIEEETDEELKFQQLPLNGLTIDQFTYWGHDELSTAYRNPDIPNKFEGCYMADDFADLKNSPVIKLKWWGSYLENEIMDPGVFRFLIAFEKDVRAQGHPDDADYIPSHPGEVLQSQFVHLAPAGAAPGPGEYSETYVNAGGPPCNEALFEYEAVLENPFPQDPNTVYWLKIVAMVDIDPAAWVQIQNILAMNPGMTLCDFLNLPFTQQQQLGLEQPITRWGWHNRDYTRMDPYAATPPAVVPGEHNPRTYIPTLPPITGLPDDMVWHFQDDAVAGEVFIDEAAPEMPMVDQPTWKDEYYKYSLPYCNTNQGVDGPDEIEYYSKDLAFELWTPTECVKKTAPFYADWVMFGKPNCWCYEYQCRGDANGKQEGSAFGGYRRVFNVDLAMFLAAYGVLEPTKGPGILSITDGICSDFNHAQEGSAFGGYRRVFNADLAIFLANYGILEPTKGPGIISCPSADYNFFVTP